MPDQTTFQSNPVPQAIADCEYALARKPADIAILNQLAMLETSDSRFAQALEHISQALKLAPKHPLLHYNRGQILGGLQQYPQEIEAYQRALTLKPDFVEAYVNMGVALRDLKRFDEAFAAFKQALRIQPEHAGARTNRAQTNLLLGNFEHGWREYEWRWQDGHQRHDVPGTRWNGKTSLQGKRLLIHAEQGLGDTIQFARYLSLLQEQGATLLLRVQTPLKELFAHFQGVSSVTTEDSPLPAFDFHIPLLSLPNVLYSRYPAIAPASPYLQADHAGIDQWTARTAQWKRSLPASHSREQVAPQAQPLLVGLCWSGNPQHLNDLNRSIRLDELKPVLQQDCIFVSLQKDLRTTDQDLLASHPEIFNTGPLLNNFADTAALVCTLDLVITVDTAVAHLCGALGIETWLLLPDPPDWRWMLHRNDSPWYGQMKLFRQAQRGNWTPVLAEVAQQLEARVLARRADD